MKENRQIFFGHFRLDIANQCVWRGDQVVPLRPRTFSVLEYLAERPGQLVTKNELLDAVWPDISVTDTVLKVCVREIREALGDAATAPRFIETAHRRGYRFVAAVTETLSDQPAAAASPSAVSPRAASKAIAVLPFKLLGPDDGDSYLALGIADALITRLGNLKQIVVRPTSAVRKYTGLDQDPVTAGHALRVGAVLDGSIHRAADRIRVTVQLVSTETEAPIWGDKFDTMFTDIFAVEDAISEQVAQALTLELTGDDRRRLTKRYTEDTAAFDLYLRGRYYWTKRTSEGLKRGAEFFRQAIDADPNYALAYTGLADCYAQLSWVGLLLPGEAFPKARAAALKALELDPLLAEAHTSLAWARLLYDWEWLDAEREFKRAIQLNANYGIAHLWYAVHLMAMGRFAEALAEIERAGAVDPLSPIINTIMGWPFYFMRRYTEAIRYYQKALDHDPNYFPARLLLASAYAQVGAFSEALAELQQSQATDDTPMVAARLAYVYAASGRAVEAQPLLSELLHQSSRQYVSAYDMAGIYTGLDEKELAFQWLERAREERSSWLIFLGVEPAFDRLREDARLDALLRSIGLAS